MTDERQLQASTGGTAEPLRRLRACVEAWPECYTFGYDPRCCRFPKSCSATVYDEEYATEAELEELLDQGGHHDGT